MVSSSTIQYAPTFSCRDSERIRTLHLGSENERTVFEAELVGTLLALDIILAEPRLTSATILLDNQSAIKALHTNKPQPGQQLVRLFHKLLMKIQKRRKTFSLQLVWVPGHCGIPGNERADELAKLAAANQSPASQLPAESAAFLQNLPLSVSATKMSIKKLAHQTWTMQWQNSKYGKCLCQFDPTPPRHKTQCLYKRLSRPAGSLLTQLRSSHVGLNPYLSQARLVDSPLCPHCNTRKTVEHFLLGCRKYIHERHEL